jgi:hypothetical protein
MSRDTLKLTTSQWTALLKALNYAPQSDVLDQIALEISVYVDLNLSELEVNSLTNEYEMIIRGANRQIVMDEKTRSDLSKLDMSKMENIQ